MCKRGISYFTTENPIDENYMDDLQFFKSQIKKDKITLETKKKELIRANENLIRCQSKFEEAEKKLIQFQSGELGSENDYKKMLQKRTLELENQKAAMEINDNIKEVLLQKKEYEEIKSRLQNLEKRL